MMNQNTTEMCTKQAAVITATAKAFIESEKNPHPAPPVTQERLEKVERILAILDSLQVKPEQIFAEMDRLREGGACV